MCTRHVIQVQQTLKRGSAVKRALASFFLAVSGMYVRAKRVVQVCLPHACHLKHPKSVETLDRKSDG